MIEEKGGESGMAQQSTNDPMRRSRQERYLVLCEGQESVTINYLAEALGVEYDVALADLRDLVASGRMGMQAYIDYYSKRLVLRSKTGDWSAWANFAGQTAETVRTAVNDSLNKAAATMAENRRKQAQQAQQQSRSRTTYTNPQTHSRARQSTASAPKRDKAIKSTFSGRRFYSLVGGVGCLSVSILGLIGALEDLAWLTMSEFLAYNAAGVVLLAAIGVLGAGLLIWRSSLKKQMIRFETYRAMIGNKDDIDLSALANAAGVKPSRTRKDIEEMISKGLLGPTAFYDAGSRKVVLRGGVRRPEPEKPVEKPAEAPAKDDNEYMTILREIRQLDEDIADEPVSEQIRRIESLTAKIFRVVEEKPEKQPQIRSFMSYYLPTTLKLLRNYSFLEKQGVDGENISAAKKNISEMLTKLESSFAQQLDQLFKSEALDISTDVDVLESMMKRDGLTDDGFRAQGGV